MKVYPNTTLQRALTDAGHVCRTLWEVKGPKDTRVAWISAYAVNGRVVLVETYADNGWTALVEVGGIEVAETVAEVKRRCGLA